MLSSMIAAKILKKINKQIQNNVNLLGSPMYSLHFYCL